VWESLRLITVWASTASYRNNFNNIDDYKVGKYGSCDVHCGLDTQEDWVWSFTRAILSPNSLSGGWYLTEGSQRLEHTIVTYGRFETTSLFHLIPLKGAAVDQESGRAPIEGPYSFHFFYLRATNHRPLRNNSCWPRIRERLLVIALLPPLSVNSQKPQNETSFNKIKKQQLLTKGQRSLWVAVQGLIRPTPYTYIHTYIHTRVRESFCWYVAPSNSSQ
jgi:hypothetical protein